MKRTGTITFICENDDAQAGSIGIIYGESNFDPPLVNGQASAVGTILAEVHNFLTNRTKEVQTLFNGQVTKSDEV